jgi:hypothetical protein
MGLGVKRPSFQFYGADWRSNAKLRRCSDAARGAWIDTLCILHDSDEYGVLRWPLADIAKAVGVPLKLLRELTANGVLKGGDRNVEAYVYTPRHAGRDGDPVTLIDANEGPCWYSSRFVRDEWVRERRGALTRFDADHQPTKLAPKCTSKAPPKPPFGERQGDGASSASSTKPPLTPTDLTVVRGTRFPDFWSVWPNSKTGRKKDKKKCGEIWRKQRLDLHAEAIIAHVTAIRTSSKWCGGYDPLPINYLRGEQWNDPLPPDVSEADTGKLRVAL